MQSEIAVQLAKLLISNGVPGNTVWTEFQACERLTFGKPYLIAGEIVDA